MPKGYVILTEAITDPAGMAAYAEAAAQGISTSGATVLAVDANVTTLEGEWHGTQTVMLEFESVESARAWYDSEIYQHAKSLRQAAAQTNAVIVAGI